MIKTYLHNLKTYVVTAFAVTLFFACQNDFKEVQKVGVLQNQPVGEAMDIDVKYTEYTKPDSITRLVANLRSPSFLDYSNRPFRYLEFPEKIELDVYGDNGEKTTIFADYAISYADTNILDLQGNVIIATHEKDTLFTDQIYYNRKLEWVFTNNSFVLKRAAGPIEGTGFDSDKSLKNYHILDMGGEFEFDTVKN